MNSYYRRVWWSVRPLFAWRLLRLLCRAFWLAAGLVIAGRLYALWRGGPWQADVWYLAGAAGWVVLFAGMALWPISLGGVTRRMDRALGLRDQVSTAYEVARRGPQNYVEGQLIEGASDLLQDANRRIWRSPTVPWSDLEMCALAVALMYALAIAPGMFAAPIVFGGDASLPPVAAEPSVPMPGLPPQLSEGVAPFGAPEEGSGGAGALDPLSAQEALNALTDALSNQSITQQAGTALAQGDADAAAQELRELADSSRDISPETQQALAQNLREAAGEVQDSAPQAAREMLESAQSLQSQDPSEAASGLEGLAQLVEDLSDAANGGPGLESQTASQSGGVGSNAGREQSGSEGLDRLPSDEGQAMELPQGDDTLQEGGVLLPPDHSAQPEGQDSTPYSQVGADDASVGQISDPLNYPWRLRGVVQRYFSSP